MPLAPIGKLIQPGTFALGSFITVATSAIVFPESMRMKTTWCGSLPAFWNFTVVSPAGIVSGAAKLKSLPVMLTTLAAGGAGGGAAFRLQPGIAPLQTASAAKRRDFIITILDVVGGGILLRNCAAAIRLAAPRERCYASRARTHHNPEGVVMLPVRSRHWLAGSLFSAVLLALPLTRIAAQAQANNRIIRGAGGDPNGAPVSGAQVLLHETQTNFQHSVTSDVGGNFAATLLPLGTYEVTARSVGFNPVTQKDITLRVGQSIDLRLTLLAITLAAVNVEATQAVVDPTKTESSQRIPVQAIEGLPNNGRNYLNLTLLTPNVSIVQGPDGDELTVSGQRGIHNNVSVDGADFNNPFFGEQRGGQRPAFTFNLDAVREVVVVSEGANAEFGRASSGFVNVITKSGTNEVHGSVHYFGKFDALSGTPEHTFPGGGIEKFNPDFSQHQFGFTLGGPLKKDKAFYFVAYDQQIYNETKQTTRPQSAALDSLTAFLGTAFGGALANDFGSIARTNDARAALVKLDFRLSERHNLSLKYNYTWSQQQNGTFDFDTWGASANGLERDYSNAVNGSLHSFLGAHTSNELRFQYSREDRPRPYDGPINPGSGTPFKDTDIDFVNAFRFGMPFFLPIKDHDNRIQLLDNVSIGKGSHLFKFGGEWNRTETVQTFIGFANGRMAFNSVTGFINYVTQGSGYVECSDGSSNPTGACPGGTTITGPVVLYLQFAGVPPLSVDAAGTQSIVQNEYDLYAQDTWKP